MADGCFSKPEVDCSYISAVGLDMSIKLGLLIDANLRKTVTSLKLYMTSLLRRGWPDLEEIWELDAE